MEKESPKRPRSIGEKIFDWTTYAGINGIGTFLLTIPIAQLFIDGPLKFTNDWARRVMGKAKFTPGLQNSILETTNMVHGGNIMLLVVGFAEYFKVPLVNFCNRLFNDPTDPASIKEAPQQTPMTLIQGRALAWMAVFTGISAARFTLGDKRFSAAQDAAGELLCKLTHQPLQVGGKDSVAYAFGRTGLLDAFATASATSILYVGSHALANAKQKRAEKALPDTTVSATRHQDTLAPSPAAEQNL